MKADTMEFICQSLLTSDIDTFYTFTWAIIFLNKMLVLLTYCLLCLKPTNLIMVIWVMEFPTRVFRYFA